MPLGLMVLLGVAALIFFGAAHRVLDRLYLTDFQALLLVALVAAGSFIDLPIPAARAQLTVNVGGALIPLGLAIYVLVRAGSVLERWRALIAAAVTGTTLWAVGRLTDFEPGFGDWLDPLWLVGLIGGGVAYLTGRSRRGAFIAATLGVLALDAIHLAQALGAPGPARVAVGGAGAFDAVVVAGVLATGLAEVVGEGVERLQGGPDTGPGRPQALFTEGGPVRDDTPGGAPGGQRRGGDGSGEGEGAQ